MTTDTFMPIEYRRVTWPSPASVEPIDSPTVESEERDRHRFEPTKKPARFHEESNAQLVRALAIRLAGEACARALRQAVVRNPLFIARFVDDAIAAAGSPARATVRLCSLDAAAVGETSDRTVLIDDALARGDVVVETQSGAVCANVADRARLLVRACADD